MKPLLRVAICIATCNRPTSLARLLDGVATLRVDSGELSVQVVIVDNDASGSSRAVWQSRAASSPWPLLYRIEPRRGIPFARNAGVAACAADCDVIAFIDDDEVPQVDWLTKLVSARERHGADVVTGPALPVFEEPPPDWAVAGDFFGLPRYATGSGRDRAFTNNVLVNCAVFRSVEGWFDERLRFTGGSDTHFFRRVHLAGFQIVWCDEAVVYDYIPADRVSRRWVVQRAYRYGHTHAFVRYDLGQDTRARLAVTAILGVRYAIWTGVLGLARRQQWRLLKSATETAYTLGMLARVVGFDYNEYRTRNAGA